MNCSWSQVLYSSYSRAGENHYDQFLTVEMEEEALAWMTEKCQTIQAPLRVLSEKNELKSQF